MERDDSRKCKVCGEYLHVMDFRIQKKDYLGLFEVCLECEPGLVEKIKSAVVRYSRTVTLTPLKPEVDPLSPDAPSPDFATDLSCMRGLSQQGAVLQHLLIALEVSVEIIGNLLNTRQKTDFTKHLETAQKQLKADSLITRQYLQTIISRGK